MEDFSTSGEIESARELGRGRWTSDLAGEKSGKEEPWEARVLELQEDGAKRV